MTHICLVIRFSLDLILHAGLKCYYCISYRYYFFQSLEMISNIRDAFNELLDELDWMDAPTKELAREKVRVCVPANIADSK